MSPQGQFISIYNILLLVTIISLLTRRLRLPSAITFIFTGIMAPLLSSFPLPSLSTEIFTSILLPPIIFHETLRLDIHGFIDDSDCIMTYAFVGTLLMLAAIAVFMNVFLGWGLVESLLLGIIFSPTDPVSVINTFSNLGVAKRFRLIVSGESLLNDGVAIALYSIVVMIVTLGSITVPQATRIVLVSVFGGVLLGILFGYAAHTLFCWTNDKFTKVLVSFLIAFGVSRISEAFGASSVVATVITGLIINYRIHNFGGLGRESVEMLEALWDFLGFIVSSVAFIFVGMNLDMSVLFSNYNLIFYFFAFILVSRCLMVFGLAEVIERLGGGEMPRGWRFCLSWSGLRGAVSTVLALGVSSLALPHSEIIIALTFGVVLISNIVQGLSISGFITLVGLSTVDEALEDEVEVDSKWMRDRYTPLGFRRESSLVEKAVFAAPEFFMFETRLGSWSVFKLQELQLYLNDHLTSNLPETSGGTLRRTLETSAYLTSKLLNRIVRARTNHYLMSKGLPEEGDVAGGLDSFHRLRKRRLRSRDGLLRK